MEHKIFQHLLELKSLQIRSSKVNESLLVKRAVDDYHKSTVELGSETGSTLRRYPYKEYTFKNFEIFLYEVLKSLQKSGSNNFQNLSDVYLEVGIWYMGEGEREGRMKRTHARECVMFYTLPIRVRV